MNIAASLACIEWLRTVDWPAWLTAIGTVAVAILAIWGDLVRSWIAGPMLELVPHNLQGESTTLRVPVDSPDQFATALEFPAVYFHLKVVNKRPWAPARNVRVLLAGILRRNEDGEFQREPVNVRQQLTWAPAEFSEVTPVIVRDRDLDLGRLIETGFTITTYATPNNFRGIVHPGGTIRVELEILADNYLSRRQYIYEITWDGQWAHNAEQLRGHLMIREV